MDPASGVVVATNGSGTILWIRVGSDNCNSGALPFSAGANCAIDNSLYNLPLNQAGVMGGTLYVTPAGHGGPIYTYDLDAGLVSAFSDHTYVSMAVGP